MALICQKEKGSCKTCYFYRKDDGDYACFAKLEGKKITSMIQNYISKNGLAGGNLVAINISYFLNNKIELKDLQEYANVRKMEIEGERLIVSPENLANISCEN